MSREAVNDTQLLVDKTPLPKDIPSVEEVGATTAPLLSASYFIGARCLPYNEDFLLCRKESNGNGEIDCLKEGRRVTRCAVSVLEDINKHCLEEFRLHWQCLEQQNHQFSGCRSAERLLNKCVFDKLVCIYLNVMGSMFSFAIFLSLFGFFTDKLRHASIVKSVQLPWLWCFYLK